MPSCQANNDGPVHNINNGTNYTTIQAAIDDAFTGDEIHVDSGTYYENVNVTKQLTIRGVATGSGQPIVDANGNGNVITLSADSITVDGFIATNSGKTSGDAGIKVISNNNVITGNIIINNSDGVHLEYSSYNNITGNNISINKEGVYVYASGNNNLTGNTANKNDYESFFLWDSTHNNITGNNVSENNFGILMWNSSNNSLTDNKVNNNSHGIYLTNSIENTLRNNQMSGNSYNFGVLGWDVVVLDTEHYSNKILKDFQMSSSSNNFEGGDLRFKNDIDTSNLVDNKPIYYLIGASDIVIDSSSNAGIVYCINCDNVTVQNLNLVNNYVGVFFYHTGNSSIQDNYLCNNDWYDIVLYSAYNNTVLRNNASDSGWEGFLLIYSDNGRIINNIVNNSYWNSMNIQFSSNNKLSGNNINNGLRGLNLFKSDNNTITGNTVLDNYYEGILLDTSMNNTIYHNMFADNYPNAVDFSLNNLWDFGYPTGGNYWDNYTGSDLNYSIDQDINGSDGIGDTPMNFTSASDKYPFMQPNGWQERPVVTGVNATEITTYTAAIVWNTDKVSDSVVFFGTEQGKYTSQTSDYTPVTQHRLNLSELTWSTTYYYIVNSTDLQGNSNQSIEYNFTTPNYYTYTEEVSVNESEPYQVNASNYTDTNIEFIPIQNVSGNITITLTSNVSDLINVTNPLNSTYGLGTNEIFTEKYVQINVTGNLSSKNVSWTKIKIFYTIADLEQNGDRDAEDAGIDLDESKMGIYWYNDSGDWIKLTPGLNLTPYDGPYIYDVGVVTDDMGIYAGYTWVNKSGFSTFALVSHSLPETDDGDTSNGVGGGSSSGGRGYRPTPTETETAEAGEEDAKAGGEGIIPTPTATQTTTPEDKSGFLGFNLFTGLLVAIILAILIAVYSLQKNK